MKTPAQLVETEFRSLHHAGHRTTFSVGEARVSVVSASAEPIEAMRSIAAPFFDESQSLSLYTVGISMSGDLWHQVSRNPIELDTHSEVRVHKSDDDSSVAMVLRDRSNKRVLVICPASVRRAGMAALRVARALILGDLSVSGLRFLHAACVAQGQTGIVITGHGTSGKTSTMLNLLHHGWDYVSNSRIGLDLDGDSRYAQGFPIHAAVRPDSLAAIPNLWVALESLRHVEVAGHRGMPDIVDKRVNISAAQLSRMFGVGVRPRCLISMIVFPEYDSAARHATLEKFSETEAARLITEQELRGRADLSPQQTYLKDIDPLGLGDARPPLFVELVMRRIFCYRLVQNRHLNPEAASLLLRAHNSNCARLEATAV